MADFSYSNPNNGQLLLLEAKRPSDSSWHPCHLSLRPTGGLTVKFEGQDSEVILFNAKDVLANLRVRSAPLQGDDCCHIEEGKNILAAYEKNSEKLFFDAVVIKVLRVRHSKRAFCRCSFMIKWLFHKAEDETLSIPSGSIMKLAAESIKSHPVVTAFLDSVESMSLLGTDLDETDHEININGLLGVQIKEMGTLVDVSKNGYVEDALLGSGHGVHFGGREAQIESPTSEHACILQAAVNCRHNKLRSSTRKQEEMKTKDESLTTKASSCGKETRENRTRLNPLAARAALASLVSKTPQKIGFLHHKGEKHISLGSMNGMTMSPVHNSHHLHNIDDPVPANLVHNVKSLWKTDERGQRVDGNILSAKKSRRVLVLERDHKSDTSKDFGIPSPLSLSGDEESTWPVTTGRVTRSAKKQENRTSNEEVKSTLLAEHVTSVRVTRSAIKQDNGTSNGEVKSTLLAEDVTSVRVTRSAIKQENKTSNGEVKSTLLAEDVTSDRVTRSAIKQENKTSNGEVKSTLLADDVTSVRVTRSGAHKRNVNMADHVQEPLGGKPRSVSITNSTAKEIESPMPKIDDNSQTCSDKTSPTTLTSTARVTRYASRKQTGTYDGFVEQSLHGRSGIESARSDNAEKLDCMTDFEASEKKRDCPWVEKPKSAARNKKQKGSNDVERKQKTTVESPSVKRVLGEEQWWAQIICGLPALLKS